MEAKNKIPYLKFFPIIFISLLSFKLIENYTFFIKQGKHFISLMSPFFWAFAFAYLLNPLMKYLQLKFKLKKLPSLIAVYIVLIGVIIFALGIITPSLLKSLKEIVALIPEYISSAEAFISEVLKDTDFLVSGEITSYLEGNITQLLEKIGSILEFSLNMLLVQIISITSSLFNFVVGIVISIYMLSGKEGIISSLKRLIIAICGSAKGKNIIAFGGEINEIFSKYLVGKLIDSGIIALLAFLLLMMINSPFTILISLIVGLTNMIPYFGPMVGMAIGSIIVLFTSPVKAFWVFIILFLLQQFDGWYLGPKILGDKVGVGALWIIFAVVVGGGFFGMLGMLLGVPFVAAIGLIVNRVIDKRLKNDI